MKLPIFPLPVFLLPEGVTRLRIFEQRYLKMVKLATKADGFAIQFSNGESKLDWASWVDIINFDQDENGLLIVDVKCKSLVAICELSTDQDNLLYGQTELLPHWPVVKHDVVTEELSTSLRRAFQQNMRLSQLYQSTFNDNANWVVARWLELLPVDSSDKTVFVDSDTYPAAKEFVERVVLSQIK